jgi:ketosteroid isomerase-like protein
MAGEAERVVRNAYDLFNRGASVDEVMPELEHLLDPEAEWVNPPDAIERGTRRGLDGWRTALENVLAGAGADARFAIEELLERGDQVFVRGFLRPRGTSSGVEVDGPMTGVIWTVRDGRICRVEWFYDLDEALAKFERLDEAPPS